MTVTILVVDDEPDLELLVTQKFRRQIREGEMKFLFADDGERALSVLKDEPDVDLVLSDINMPRMDGLTLLRRLQGVHNDLRAVMVSAYGDMRNIRAAMNLGAFDFVTKPIEFEDLQLTIKKTLDDLERLREVRRLHAAAEQGKANLSRYFSPNLARQLADEPALLNPGCKWRELSFVFSDLADFTPLVETLEPSVIVPLLNEYLDEMTRIVFRQDGTVDKVVGDAVHAMFGAPLKQPDHAARAVACAIEMDAFAEAFRERQRAHGFAFGVTRIGVHTGPAIVGNFGGERFFDYTAHGETINTAARLEAANKKLGTRVCVSAQTVDRTPNFMGRPVGTLALKGRREGLPVFEPLPADHADTLEAQAYREAFAKLEAGDPAASQAFAAVVGQYGEDALTTFHLKRLLGGQKSALITFAEE